MGFRTQAQVDRLKAPEGKADAYVWDDEQPGLSVRLKGGKRSWVVWYGVGNRRRKITLGAMAGLPLKEARIKASKIIADARDGKDALAERDAAKARTANTFGALVRLYLERRAKPRQRPGTYAETHRYLMRHWASLHERPVDSLTRRDVAGRLEEIRVDRGPIAANRARVHLSGLYSWAMRQGLVENNPVIGTEAPAEERRRDRVLSPAELAALWRAADGAGDVDALVQLLTLPGLWRAGKAPGHLESLVKLLVLAALWRAYEAPSAFGAQIKLLLLTGQRRSEVAGLHRSEVDLDRALWTLPRARTKNGREHEVPLSRQALALIERWPGPFLFGRGGRTPYSGFSRAKARLDQAAGIAPWTLHDLRRSAVTHMVELGIEPHVVEAIVNHVSGHKGGVAGRYNFAAYREPKRVALQRWADWLEAVVEGREPASNVVALQRGAA